MELNEDRCRGESPAQVCAVDSSHRVVPSVGACPPSPLSAVSLSLKDGCFFLWKLSERVRRESSTVAGDQGPPTPVSLLLSSPSV